MKKSITILCFFVVCTLCAETNHPSVLSKLAYCGFSGGMMLHTGYVHGRAFSLSHTDGSVAQTVQMKGAPTGIGGAARFHFGKHLRIGTEGYVSTLRYGQQESYASIGWGGLLADYQWTFGRWMPFVGGTVGGGTVKNLTLLEETPVDYVLEQSSASFRKYGFLALAPFAGVEFAMSKKIHLMFKVDYIINLNNRQNDFVTGPRLYCGFAFCR
ncbi:MAG: hypothetical protein LBS16_05945 [Prevotellaceae bacterium]|jgi:hypothetical protein|nr:hypothetical protein [Prevotellaceae bacterium]